MVLKVSRKVKLLMIKILIILIIWFIIIVLINFFSGIFLYCVIVVGCNIFLSFGKFRFVKYFIIVVKKELMNLG